MSTEQLGPFRRLAPSAAAPTIDAETGRATFIFNTEEVGRDGHVVFNRGICTENFDLNPTILFAHDDKQPPIGRATAIRIGEPASKVDIEFTSRELYPFGAMIGELVRGRYLNACSMSWMPIEWKFSTDRARPGGVDFLKVDLLEISVVPVPALPDAIATARAHGIDTTPLREWAEKILDTGGHILVPRAELEDLRRAAKMPEPSKLDLKAKHARALARAPKMPVFKRGLYDVAQMAYMLESLGYCHDCSEYETALEGDDSPVPAMIGEALEALATAFKAAAAEEADELLEAHEDDDDEESMEVEARGLSEEDRVFIAAGKTPRARAWRAGVAVARAGKALSNSNQEKLEEADGHHDRALKHHKQLGEHHEAVSGHLKEARDAHAEATSTLKEFGEHVRGAQENPDDPLPHLKRAMKAHAKTEEQMGAVADAHENAQDRHEDVGDSHRAAQRCVRSAKRCVRSVVDGAASSEPDEADGDDQTDKNDKDKDAVERAAAERRRRRAKAVTLNAPA